MIKSASPESFLPELQHQCLIPEDTAAAEKAIALVDILSRRVSLWEMTCTKDPAAAQVSFEAMSGAL